MLRSSARPNGVRLTRASQVKLKCIEIAPPPGTNPTGSWPYLWGAGWNASTITACLTQIKALGANAVKVTGSSANELNYNYPAEATYRVRRQFFLQQCRGLGLAVYWTLGNGANTVFGSDGRQAATLMPPLVALASTLGTDGSDIIAGFDVCNEINYSTPLTWNAGDNQGVTAQMRSDMRSLVAAFRAVTSIPLSASVLVSTPALMKTSPYLDLQYDIGLDFHDVHPYYQDHTVVAGGNFPAAADFASLETRTKYLGRHFIGEMGCCLAAGTVLQNRWYNGIGDIANRAHSFGAVMFILTDWDTRPAYQYGMFPDYTFTSPRTGMTVPFSTWPGSI